LLKYKWTYLLGVLFIILSNLFAILMAPIVRMAVDTVTDSLIVFRHFNGFNLNDEIINMFTGYAVFFALLVLISAIIKGIFMFFMRQTMIVGSRYIEYDLKNEIFDHYQKLSLSFYNKNFTGDLMNRISEDVSRVRMYLGPAIMYTVNLVFLFMMVIGVMIAINPEITLYVLLPLPVLSVSIYYVSDIINHRSDRIQQKLSEMTSFVQEAFSGIRVVKSFAIETKVIENFEKESDDYKEKSMHLVHINALFFPLMLLLVGSSVLITVWVGGREVVYGNFTVGNIAEYIIYVNMLTWPVASLGWVTSLVQRAAASQRRINEFLSLKPEIHTESAEKVIFNDRITFRNVSFRFPDKNDFVLKNINFEILKGKKVGIVGLTGSGKSTIAQLLLRMYDVADGEILLDGVNIKSLDLVKYRSLFGYVPQDVFLFSDSIAGNIDFGLDQSEKDGAGRPEQIREAARVADVLVDIDSFDKQFDTILGERGITLSGGQKQRVAIARAVIKNPDILLLDDSLSAVDTGTEGTIKQNLIDAMNNNTSIFISHRVSVIEESDTIFVLDHGEIVEQGSSAELLEKEGIFAQLRAKQQTNGLTNGL
jgi:ATP-binding cassette subfamily B protein